MDNISIKEISKKFMIVSNNTYESFTDIIFKKKKIKMKLVKHVLKYNNEYYIVKPYESLTDIEENNFLDIFINKKYNLLIKKISICRNYVTPNNYTYTTQSIKDYFLIINKKIININPIAINYSYNNFIHKKLGSLFYLTINLEKTDLSEFIWHNSSIENLILENKFNWETNINDLTINQGCPLLGLDRFNNIKILGIYYCKTIDYVNDEYEPLLWFIPSYTILQFASQIYNKINITSSSYDIKIIDNYEIKDNKIILNDDYKIANNIIIPKNSRLITYNNKMLIFGDNIRDKINIKFTIYQNYDPITRISYEYNNRYYIKNIKNKTYNNIPIYYNYIIDRKSCYNYNGFIFIKLSLEFINFILNSNLIIDSYIISQLINNPYSDYPEKYIYCLISCPDQYLYKYDEKSYLYKILSNLVGKYIYITKYLEDRPQMIYVPIIKDIINFNKSIKTLNLLIDTDIPYRINL